MKVPQKSPEILKPTNQVTQIFSPKERQTWCTLRLMKHPNIATRITTAQHTFHIHKHESKDEHNIFVFLKLGVLICLSLHNSGHNEHVKVNANHVLLRRGPHALNNRAHSASNYKHRKLKHILVLAPDIG